MTASEERLLSGRVFAVLYLSFNTLIAAFWALQGFGLRFFLYPPLQEWFSNAAARRSTSFWDVIGVNLIPDNSQTGFIMGIVPSLLFAALMMWNWERLCEPRQLRPILRRTGTVALVVMGLLAGFLLLNGITPFSPDPYTHLRRTALAGGFAFQNCAKRRGVLAACCRIGTGIEKRCAGRSGRAAAVSAARLPSGEPQFLKALMLTATRPF